MRMIHKKMKKGLAAFLAVCMVASSLQISGRSTALGAESEKEASVLEFDRAKLREAAYNAVSNTQMVQPPSVVATSSNAVGTGFDMTSFELADAPSLLAEGVSMPADTGLRIFLTPQWQGFDDEDGTYHLTGDETLTFMIENESGEEQGYQLLFGDKLTEIIHIESKKELLKEYKVIQDEEDEGILVPGGGSGSGGGGGSAAQPTQPGESAGTGETQAPEESGSTDETGSQVPEESGSTDETESQPEESGSTDETESQPEESGSTDETGSQPEESGSTDETGSQPEESGSTDETGSQPEETEAQPEEGGNTGDTGSQTPDEDKDSAGDTGNETGDNTDTGSSTDTDTEEEADSDVSILGKAVDILTGTITAHAAELLPIATDSEADPLPEATPSEPEEDSDVSIATDSNAGKTQTSFVSSLDESAYTRLEPVHVSESTLIYKDLKTVDLVEDAENISMAVFSLELEEEEDTTPKASNTSAVAFYGVRVGDIVPLADVAGSLADIEVSLYDYSGSTSSEETNLNNGKEYSLQINRYLKNTGLTDGKNVFLFGGGQDKAFINRYWAVNNDFTKQAQNIYQGIPDALGSEKLFNTLFPEEQGTISSRAIKVYSGVNVDEFFTLENGQYSYDSDENGAVYDSESLTAVDENGGFWPFGTSNWYFGMKMQFDFYKPKDGQYMNKDMKFSFSGDDDVWVYLTNKTTEERYLVLDIGGNHGRMDGSINFADGTISYTNESAKETPREKGPVIHNASDIYEKADGINNATIYTTNIKDIIGTEDSTFFTDDPAEYTLEFYYLERGGNASNCKLDFNLPVIPKNGVGIEKRLTGSEADIADHENDIFDFNIVYSEDLDELKDYYEGNTEASVSKEGVYITGTGDATVSNLFDSDRESYFFAEETGRNRGEKINWSGSGEPVYSSSADSKSPIYKVPKGESGYRIVCENIYGDFAPTIAKRAWKDWTSSDGEYDVTLEVTGDEKTTTSGSTQGGPVNVVFAIDKSASMSQRPNNFDSVKNCINDLIDTLAEGSYVSIVAYSSDEVTNNAKWNSDRQKFKDYKYYDELIESGADSYYTSYRWRSVEEKDHIKIYINNNIEADGGTHSAAGFLGAYNMIKNAPRENQTFVIYLTDGVPTYGLVRYSNWGGSIGRGYTGSGSSSNTYTIGAARHMLDKLKTDFSEVPVYAVAYNTNVDWLSSAQQDGALSGYYSVSGTDELKEILGQITTEITTKVPLEDVVVTDTIDTNNVTLEDIGNGVQAPKLYLVNAKVSGTEEGDGNVNVIPAASKGTELTRFISGDTVTYTFPGTDTVIAEYTISSHTIKWYVGRDAANKENNIGNKTQTLTYHVTANRQTVEPTDRANYDTGTHSGETGFYSNVSAEIKWTGGEDTFPHPVVIPEIIKTDLTITKAVTGIESEDNVGGIYSFTITFGSDFDFASYTPSIEGATRTANGYTFELQADGSITFPDLPEGTSYTVTETDWELTGDNADEYVLTQIQAVSGSTTESTTENRPETLEFEGTVPENNSTVTFTNTFSKYGYITIEKKVDGTAPSNEFSFSITGSEGSALSKDYGSVQVPAGGSTVVQIEPEDIDKTFVITETDTQNAWLTTVQKNSGQSAEAVSVNAESGDTITFTNIYYAHQLTLKKTVDNSPNPYPNAEYDFTIILNREDGQSLTDKEKQAVKLGSKAVVINADNQITTSLKADGFISLTGLPQTVTSVTITENLTQPTDGAYSLALQAVWKANGGSDNMLQPVNNAVTITLPTKADYNETITFQNKYTPENGTLTITKQIVDERGKPVSIEENRTFTFKVEQLDEKNNVKMTFYKTIQVSEGEPVADTGEITVPAGTYRITEIPTLKYKCTSENPQEVIITGGGTGGVTFQNYKTTDSYFTDVSCEVNKVVNNGNGSYEYQKSSTSPSLAERLGWAPSKSKQEDET